VTDKGFCEIVELHCQLLSAQTREREREREREKGKKKKDEKGEKCIELTDIDFKCAVPTAVLLWLEIRNT